jgi:hypothetical protein
MNWSCTVFKQFGCHELVLHGLQADLGGLGTVLMPPHAIEHEHDPRVVRHDDRRPVLVVLAVTSVDR